MDLDTHVTPSYSEQTYTTLFFILCPTWTDRNIDRASEGNKRGNSAVGWGGLSLTIPQLG